MARPRPLHIALWLLGAGLAIAAILFWLFQPPTDAWQRATRPLELAVGEAAVLGEESLRVEVLTIDSRRCPPHATCVAPDSFKVTLKVGKSGRPETTLVLSRIAAPHESLLLYGVVQPGTRPTVEREYEGHGFQLMGVRAAAAAVPERAQIRVIEF